MSKDVQTKVTTTDDGKFVRTALVPDDGESGSVDVLDGDGQLLCRINIFVYQIGTAAEHVIVDVIDVDKRRFTKRTALVFEDGQRKFVPTNGSLVSADFRNGEETGT